MGDPFDKISDKNELNRMRREAAAEDLQGSIERAIDEAQKKGMFENLPGEGKPLKLRKNPYAGDRSLAFELLQNNDYTLPWISDRNEVLAKIDAIRADLLQEWHYYQRQLEAVGSDSERLEMRQKWQHYLRDLEAAIAGLNKKISRVNLSIPSERLEVIKLSLEKELRRIGASD